MAVAAGTAVHAPGHDGWSTVSSFCGRFLRFSLVSHGACRLPRGHELVARIQYTLFPLRGRVGWPERASKEWRRVEDNPTHGHIIHCGSGIATALSYSHVPQIRLSLHGRPTITVAFDILLDPGNRRTNGCRVLLGSR